MNAKKTFRKELENKFGSLSFGSALASWRQSELMTQREFAEKLEISPQNLNDLEKERKIPSATRAAQIAKKLKIPEILLIQMIQIALRDQLRKEGFNYDVMLG